MILGSVRVVITSVFVVFRSDLVVPSLFLLVEVVLGSRYFYIKVPID